MIIPVGEKNEVNTPVLILAIPVTTISCEVFGALAIAASIVAVVVASSEAMFWSCLELLITVVPLIETEPAVTIPE